MLTRYQPANVGRRYFVIDIGTLGGNQGVAEGISNRGWVVGGANLSRNQSIHAILWRHGILTDLGTLGGANSEEQWPVKDDIGLIVGDSEIDRKDPYKEDFCGFDANAGVPYTGLICKPFLWKKGVMTALPTLGGRNGQASAVNDLGEVAGIAETRTRDSQCVAPQTYDASAVIWGPDGKITVLPPLHKDVMAWAIGINDGGQVVGVSGKCISPNFNLTHKQLPHGVIWGSGSVKDLGSLGGTKSTFPWAINKHGQVVGDSYLSGNVAFHPFLWQNGVMTDLGTMYPDVDGYAFGENNRGDVVGGSGVESVGRAYIWHGGVMTNLNDRIAEGSAPDYLFWGNDINDRGEIALYAFNTVDQATHAAVAIPCDELKGRCGKNNLRIVVPAATLREAFKRLPTLP